MVTFELGQRSWKVAVSLSQYNLFFTEGWASFCRDLSLENGFMLTFRIIDALTLDVMIFNGDGVQIVNIPEPSSSNQQVFIYIYILINKYDSF